MIHPRRASSDTERWSGRAANPAVVEKLPLRTPPLLRIDAPAPLSPLRRFTALPDDAWLVLGARRAPPAPCPGANTGSAFAVSTSVGFRSLASADFAAAAHRLRPDVVIAPPDIPLDQGMISAKRRLAMSYRTEKWLGDLTSCRRGSDAPKEASQPAYNTFASILPRDPVANLAYSKYLAEEALSALSGLAIYDSQSIQDLPPELHHLPRLSLHLPSSPHGILDQISVGMDIFTIPFLSEAADAGIALSFTFPAPSAEPPQASPLPQSLGLDMWHPAHATSLSPLVSGCPCYACTQHHCAYVRHLLNANEMLGWTLLQLHNHSVLDAFFAGVRTSIAQGTFAADRAAFDAFYAPALPVQTGQGPRVRGYQFKGAPENAGAGDEKATKGKPKKKNPKAYTSFERVGEKRGVLEDKARAEEVSEEALHAVRFMEEAMMAGEHHQN